MKNSVTAIIPTMLNDSGLFYLVEKLVQDKIPTVIIDNQPNAKKRQLSQKSNITYLPQNENLGFAASVNLGAKVAKTDWLLILNDDIELQPKQSFSQIFSQLINYAQKSKLTAVSPVLVNKQGRVENYGYRVLPYGKVELNLDPKNTNIDGLTAACLLIRRDIFLKVGGFDQRFFAYLEDVDLFLTLKKRNYRFAIHPKLSVIHNHLTTSSKMKRGFKQWHDFKNWILLSIKHIRLIRFDANYFLERLKNFKSFIFNNSDKNISHLNFIQHVNQKIIGRWCGSNVDKLMQIKSTEYIAKKYPNKPQFAHLEIGVLFGGSILAKLYALKLTKRDQQTIIAVDPFEGYYGKKKDPYSGISVTRNNFKKNLSFFGFKKSNLLVISEFSPNKKIDHALSSFKLLSLMIDGDHSYKGIKKDWLAYTPYLIKGGTVLVDDYNEPAWPGVTKFIDEVRAKESWKWRKLFQQDTTLVLQKAY